MERVAPCNARLRVHAPPLLAHWFERAVREPRMVHFSVAGCWLLFSLATDWHCEGGLTGVELEGGTADVGERLLGEFWRAEHDMCGALRGSASALRCARLGKDTGHR